MKGFFLVIVTLLIIPSVHASSTRFQKTINRFERQYGLEIIELPQWASRMADRYIQDPSQKLLGLTLPEEGKILLFTRDLCEQVRWETLYHELFHAIYKSFDEEGAKRFSKRKMKRFRINQNNNCKFTHDND